MLISSHKYRNSKNLIYHTSGTETDKNIHYGGLRSVDTCGACVRVTTNEEPGNLLPWSACILLFISSWRYIRQQQNVMRYYYYSMVLCVSGMCCSYRTRARQQDIVWYIITSLPLNTLRSKSFKTTFHYITVWLHRFPVLLSSCVCVSECQQIAIT